MFGCVLVLLSLNVASACGGTAKQIDATKGHMQGRGDCTSTHTNTAHSQPTTSTLNWQVNLYLLRTLQASLTYGSRCSIQIGKVGVIVQAASTRTHINTAHSQPTSTLNWQVKLHLLRTLMASLTCGFRARVTLTPSSFQMPPTTIIYNLRLKHVLTPTS